MMEIEWVVSNWRHISLLTFDFFVLLLLLFIFARVESVKGSQGRKKIEIRRPLGVN